MTWVQSVPDLEAAPARQLLILEQANPEPQQETKQKSRGVAHQKSTKTHRTSEPTSWPFVTAPESTDGQPRPTVANTTPECHGTPFCRHHIACCVVDLGQYVRLSSNGLTNSPSANCSEWQGSYSKITDGVDFSNTCGTKICHGEIFIPPQARRLRTLESADEESAMSLLNGVISGI